MNQIAKYVFRDVLRTRFVIVYAAFLALSTTALFQLSGDESKVVLSLLNIVLMVTPIVSIIFFTIHYFNSYEFISLLLAQPVSRKVIFYNEYIGVASSLCGAYIVGIGLPALIFGAIQTMLPLITAGIMLTCIFVSLAALASVLTSDKAKAIGIALLFWFYFSLIYDGILLWIVYSFSEYPLEKVTLALICLNPVDLARISLLMSLDISALMGYTGAFYKDFFGNSFGMLFTAFFMIVWALVPLYFAQKIFLKKDL
jgi:Cu-processing system permease protein